MSKVTINKSKSSKEPPLEKGEIVRMVLGVIGMSGVLIGVAVAPGLLHLVKPLITASRRTVSKKSLDAAVRRLKKRGLIRLAVGPNGWRVELTDLGLRRWFELENTKTPIKIPKRWDKKWRLLIFDIPERNKHLRNKVRQLLIQFGFQRLQDSVWLYPYECQDLLELMRTHYRIRYNALYIRAEYIDKDDVWKKRFHLKIK